MPFASHIGAVNTSFRAYLDQRVFRRLAARNLVVQLRPQAVQRAAGHLQGAGRSSESALHVLAQRGLRRRGEERWWRQMSCRVQ